MKKTIFGFFLFILATCFLTITAAQNVMMRISVDNVLAELYINGKEINVNKDLPGAANWQQGDLVEFKMGTNKNVIAMKCTDSGVIAGLLVDLRYDKTLIISDKSLKYNIKEIANWQMVNFKDDKWKKAVEYHKYPEGIWAKRVPIFDKPMTNPWWIWSDTNVQGGKIDTPVYFRLTFGDLSVEPANKVAVRWGQLRAGIKLNISN